MPDQFAKTLTFGQYRILIAIQQLMTTDQLDLVTGFQHPMVKRYLHFLLDNRLITATADSTAIRYELAESGRNAIMQYEEGNPELVIRQQTATSMPNTCY